MWFDKGLCIGVKGLKVSVRDVEGSRRGGAPPLRPLRSGRRAVWTHPWRPPGMPGASGGLPGPMAAIPTRRGPSAGPGLRGLSRQRPGCTGPVHSAQWAHGRLGHKTRSPHKCCHACGEECPGATGVPAGGPSVPAPARGERRNPDPGCPRLSSGSRTETFKGPRSDCAVIFRGKSIIRRSWSLWELP